MKNENLKSYLNYYIEHESTLGFAVMIEGPWGAGKTYFIKQYIESKTDYNFLYVSLNGVKDAADIDDQIYKQMHPVLSSSKMKIMGKVLRGFAKGALRIDFDGDGNHDGQVNPDLSKLEASDFMKDPQNCCMVFDDLERSSMSSEETMAYINYFTEIAGLKAVVLSNEHELINVDKKSSQGDDGEIVKSKYEIIKEKTIGKTFRYNSDITSAILGFINSFDCHHAASFLSNKVDLVHSVYDASGFQSLRLLRAALFDLEYFLKIIDDSRLGNGKFLDDLIVNVVSVSLEVSGNCISQEDLSHMELDSCHASFLGAVNESYADGFGKYTQFNLLGRVPSSKYLKEYFISGGLDVQDFRGSVNESVYFTDVRPLWLKLLYFEQTEDQEFSDLIDEALSNWNSGEFGSVYDLLHITALLIHFANEQILDLKVDEIIKSSMKHLLEMIERGVVDCSSFLEDDRWYQTGHNYFYYIHDSPEMKQLTEEFRECLEGCKLKQLSEKFKTEVLSLPDNYEEFSSNISAGYGIYIYQPVFSELDPGEFMECLLKCSPDQRRDFSSSIKSRFERPRMEPVYTGEEKFWKKLLAVVDSLIDEEQGLITRYYLKNRLRPIVEDVASKAEDFRT